MTTETSEEVTSSSASPFSALAVHSATLPALSKQPDGDTPSGNCPTATGPVLPDSRLLQRPGSKRGPQGYRRPSEPRAATSHSSSVGKRLPDHVAKALAATQLTPATGWFSSSSLNVALPASSSFHFAGRYTRLVLGSFTVLKKAR